jgi:hypothetical protein
MCTELAPGNADLNRKLLDLNTAFEKLLSNYILTEIV